MSQTATHEVRCRCGAAVQVFCAESINAERHPHMRDAILARTLHVFQCGACLGTITVDKELLYVDLARREMYAVHPASERADERAHGEALIATWSRTVGDTAGAAARAAFDGDHFHVRLCYGLEELREKIVAHAAGLRDLVLEAVKAEAMAGPQAASPRAAGAVPASPAFVAMASRSTESENRRFPLSELRALGVIALRLDGVAPDGRLGFVAECATDPPSVLELGLLIDRARYDELAALAWQDLIAKFPGIAAGPHVSMLRWTLPP